jgi:hypothetical protein
MNYSQVKILAVKNIRHLGTPFHLEEFCFYLLATASRLYFFFEYRSNSLVADKRI